MQRRTFTFELLAPPRVRPFAERGPSSSFPILQRQQPPMLLKDEVIFLLHTAAEIEHALMAQYLYAAYSLPDTPPHQAWQEVLLAIAREEMGHLMCAQNILLGLGGPLNFEREDYPFNAFYPFPFRLEPLSVRSVARYVLAEMPEPSVIPASLGFDLDEIIRDADAATPDGHVNRVGSLFNLLIGLVQQLAKEELHKDSEPFQADPAQWLAAANNLLLDKIPSVAIAGEFLQKIADQGEGPAEPPSGPLSHFRRLFAVYKSVKEQATRDGPGSLSNAMPVNPSVYKTTSEGYLGDPAARAWGDLFNHRFRWLLACLEYYLRTDDNALRNTLKRWAFDEMHTLRDVARVLTSMPQHSPIQVTPDERPRVAGPPFELPYTVSLPTRGLDMWRHHEMLAVHGIAQLNALPSPSPLVAQLRTDTEIRLTFIRKNLE